MFYGCYLLRIAIKPDASNRHTVILSNLRPLHPTAHQALAKRRICHINYLVLFFCLSLECLDESIKTTTFPKHGFRVSPNKKYL